MQINTSPPRRNEVGIVQFNAAFHSVRRESKQVQATTELQRTTTTNVPLQRTTFINVFRETRSYELFLLHSRFVNMTSGCERVSIGFISLGSCLWYCFFITAVTTDADRNISAYLCNCLSSDQACYRAFCQDINLA